MSIFKKISSVYSNRLGALEQKLINYILQRKKKIVHNDYKFTFFIPNALNRYRVKTFATKEPKTLKWIDSFAKDVVLWDIGANIGLYSIYAAKTKDIQVFAFEPSVFNLELLAKNIHINKLQEKIIIFPLALSYKNGFNLFKMNNPVWGGALSSFGVDFDQHGRDFKSSFEYSILGLNADDVARIFNIAKPDYIKIDVDGIEHLILSGASNILKTVKSVLVEINDDFTAQHNDAQKYLLDAGLTLFEKHGFDFSNQTNQLWIRN